MPRKVNYGARFVRDIKSLQKRFPLMELDVREFQREIEAGAILGEQLAGMGFVAYKARLPNRSARRGKRGGFRLLYALDNSEEATFVHIYSKTDDNDPNASEIRGMLSELV